MEEFGLIANLLAYPSQIQQIEVKAGWFNSEANKAIVKGIIASNGELTRMIDIADKVNQFRPLLEKISPENLEMMRDSNDKKEGYFIQMMPFLQRDFLKKKLLYYAQEYTRDPLDKYLAIISECKEQLDAIMISKDSGTLGNVQRYLEGLFDGSIQPHFIKTFPQFDNAFAGGFQRDRLYIIGARPSVGKSAMGANLVVEALRNNKTMRVDFFSLESTKEQNVFRMLANQSSINSKLIANPQPLNDHRKDIIMQNMQKLLKTDLRVFNEQYRSKNAIVNKIRQRATTENYLAVIDYAGLVEIADRRKNEVEKINEITRDFKLLANELHIPIVLLAQVNRAGAGKSMPTLSDLKGSGSLEQDADVVILMYRQSEEDPSSVMVYIAKNRDGQIGMLHFNFIPEYSRFEDKKMGKNN